MLFIKTPNGYLGHFGQCDFNMKKILFILLILIPTLSYSQYLRLNIASITGTDTTIYRPANNTNLVQFDFTTFNANDAQLDFGYSHNTVSFVTAEADSANLYLNKTTYTKTTNGYTRNQIAFIPSDSKWYGPLIAFKLTKNSVTTGFLDVWW